MPTATLILDLDGTLSDPAVGIGRSINYALEHFGYAPITEDSVSRYIGPPLDQSFRAITRTESDAHVSDLVARYRERYADVGYAENTVYPGIPEALAALSAAGVPLGLCTSKRADFAHSILALFGLARHFRFVSGGEIGVPKSQQLAALLRDGTVSKASLMIGDRAVDVEAARANGLAAVGVLWGHGSEDELRSANPSRLLRHPPELAGLQYILPATP